MDYIVEPAISNITTVLTTLTINKQYAATSIINIRTKLNTNLYKSCYNTCSMSTSTSNDHHQQQPQPTSSPLVIRHDYTLYSECDTNSIDWLSVPDMPGVHAKFIEYSGNNDARNTLLAKFDPLTSVPIHTHNVGEEFYVIDGAFNDEREYYNTGYYARHPKGTAHEPTSQIGTTFLVKQAQLVNEYFDNNNDDNSNQSQHSNNMMSISSKQSSNWVSYTPDNGSSVLRGTRNILCMYSDNYEYVGIESWLSNTCINEWVIDNNGEELYIIEGDLNVDVIDNIELDNTGIEQTNHTKLNDIPLHSTYTAGYWIRRPNSYAGLKLRCHSVNGCNFFIKKGHLRSTK